jgi:hypothetical protein
MSAARGSICFINSFKCKKENFNLFINDRPLFSLSRIPKNSKLGIKCLSGNFFMEQYEARQVSISTLQIIYNTVQKSFKITASFRLHSISLSTSNAHEQNPSEYPSHQGYTFDYITQLYSL